MPVNMRKPRTSVLESIRASSVPSFRKWRKYAALVIVLGVASACSQSDESEALLSRYQQDLAGLYDADVTPPAQTSFLPMPRSTDLREEIDRISIGLLDSMQLDKCRAGGLIAQRNSALGKMQTPSARLRYELDSLMALAECRDTPIAEDKRIDDMLVSAIEHKQDTLPHYIDRALATGDDVRHALRPATQMLPLRQNRDASSIAALEYIAHTLDKALNTNFSKISLKPYNRHFQTLAQENFLPRYWRSQIRTQKWLQALNDELSMVNQSPVCTSNWQQAHATYSDELRPLLMRWQDYRAQITPPLTVLRRLSKQPEWRTYLHELSRAGKQIHEQIQQHDDMWRDIATACDS